MIRAIMDVIGDVTQNGNVLHSGVRVMRDGNRRIAVFTARNQPPTAVYEDGEVEVRKVRAPCGCKGDVSKITLQKLWTSAEKVSA